MAISNVQAASANASSVAISTPNAGDLILVMAYNDAAATAPTLLAGYTSITSTTSTLEGAILAFKIAVGNETSTGTWTNATNIVCIVYRGTAGIGNFGTAAVGNSASIGYPTLTLKNAHGSSWVAGFAGAKGATAGMNGTASPLTSNRTSQTTVNGLDTNGGVTSFAGATLTVTTSGRWAAFSVEILAATYDDGSLDDGWRVALTSALGNQFAAIAAWPCTLIASCYLPLRDPEEIPAGSLVHPVALDDGWR